MSDYYDIHGRAISITELTDRRHGDDSDFVKAKRETHVEDSTVSTVWLGMDYSWGDGPPLIFESMVFGGGLNQEQVRYPTLAEAHAGHDALVDRVRVEADAFRALAADAEVAGAVRLVQERLTAHLGAFDICDYDGAAYARLVKAVSA